MKYDNSLHLLSLDILFSVSPVGDSKQPH